MKTIAGMLAALLVLAAPAAAQRPGPGGRGPGDRPGMTSGVERAVGLALERRDSLALSADQVQQLEAFRTELEASRTALREEMERARAEGGDRDAIRERMEALRERVQSARDTERERFEAILPEQQRERLQELVRQDRRRGPGGPGGRGRGPGFRRGAFGPAFGPGGFAGGFGPRAALGAGGYRQGYLDGLGMARRASFARRGPPPFRGWR